MFKTLFCALLISVLFLFGCDNGGGDDDFVPASSVAITTPGPGPGGTAGTAFVTPPTAAIETTVFEGQVYSFIVTVTGVSSVGGRFSATLDTSTDTANFDGLSVAFSALTPVAPGVFQSTGTLSGPFTGTGTVTITVTYREDELEITSTFFVTIVPGIACTATLTTDLTSPIDVVTGGADVSIIATGGSTSDILGNPVSGDIIVSSLNDGGTGGVFSTVGTNPVTINFTTSSTTTPGVASFVMTYDLSAANPACTPIVQTFTINVLPTSFSSTPGATDPVSVIDTIVVPAGAPTVTDTRVLLDISHVFVADIEITLTSPTGTTIFLTDHSGGGTNDMLFVFDDNDPNALDVTLTDLGGNLGSASPRVPFLSYQTSENVTSAGATSLNSFNGEAMSGTWTLDIFDTFAAGSPATLNAWTLAFNGDLSVIEAPSTLTFDTPGPVTVFECDTATVLTTCTVSPTGGTFSLGFDDISSGATTPFSIDPTTGDLTYDPSTATVDGSDFVEVIYTPLIGLPSLAVYQVDFVTSSVTTVIESPALAIPGPGGAATTDTLTVTGAGCIQNMQLGIGITHAFRSDLDIRLTSPEGTTVILTTGVGGPALDFRVVFRDTAASDITSYTGVAAATSPTFAGYPAFNPEGAATLSVFNGESGDGIWTISVTDTFTSLDDGTLDDWGLRLNVGF